MRLYLSTARVVAYSPRPGFNYYHLDILKGFKSKTEEIGHENVILISESPIEDTKIRVFHAQIRGDRTGFELNGGYAFVAPSTKEAERLLYVFAITLREIGTQPLLSLSRGELTFQIEGLEDTFEVSLVNIKEFKPLIAQLENDASYKPYHSDGKFTWRGEKLFEFAEKRYTP